ncbi:MAG: DUF6044 family protein [Acetatifactor sp.]|nr:DUF6044 family protein [Acetatifactor sp.]
MERAFQKNSKKYFFFFGLVILAILHLPYLWLGENAIITYHDQLDGDLLTYIYQAKYLFSGEDILPEFMNGASKTALISPAPFAVLLFCVLPPFAALIMMQAVGQMVAYIGMFLVADKLTGNKVLCLAAGLFYALLPVYGLSQYGIPLLFLSFYGLYRKEHSAACFVYVFIYTALSSLVLCGYIWVLALAMWSALLLIKKEGREHQNILFAFLEMSALYLIENCRLAGQMLGFGNAVVSHKSEYINQSSNVFSAFINYFLKNAEHSEDYHQWTVVLVLIILVVVFLLRRKCSAEMLQKAKWVLQILGAISVICLLSALWDSAFVVQMREKMGTIGSFQFSRLLWMAPALWMIELVLCLDILWTANSRRKWLGYIVGLLLLVFMSLFTLKGMPQKTCVRQILQPGYSDICYGDYYANGVLEQVESFLQETTGQEKEDYKVASLGIDPAAALYHGFYCVDGYSNNYSLEYKHAFRKVIAPELDRSEYLRRYFDDWGNRCYLFSSETPGYFTIQKNGFYFSDLKLDMTALGKLGCDYILSAAYILNAEEEGLELLREEPFETQESYYRIFLYKINAR